MQETSKIEENWHLLFDIALGYGESLLMQKITYPGFITFLQSTDLLGVKHGVYLVLIEKLWKLHAVFLSNPRNQELFENEISSGDYIPGTMRSPTYDFCRREVLTLGVCGFEGFIDMMKVVCVRSWQCKMCTEYYVKYQETLANSVLLSAEDMVSLQDSVKFVAHTVFKWFIPRNLICPNTRITLNPLQNSWTPLTNDVIRHIVGSLVDSVLLPLFRRFSVRGLMGQLHFSRFIDTFFPSFSGFQRAAASAVFSWKDFFDPYSLLQFSRVEVDISEWKAGNILSFAGFVEALLMLGIIAFADEEQFPHHRPITAKIWFTFENIYCPGVGKAVMPEDPLFTGKYKSIKPVISFVFPHVISWESVSSVLIGGLNLRPYEGISPADVESGRVAAFVSSSRLLLPNSQKMNADYQTEGEASNSFPNEDFMIFSPDVSTEQLVAEKAEEQHRESHPPISNDTGEISVSGKREKSRGRSTISIHEEDKTFPMSEAKKDHQIGVSKVALKALNDKMEEVGKKPSLHFDSPIYGMRFCKVFVNDCCAQTIDHGSNHVEVLIPLSLTRRENFRMSVYLEESVKCVDGRSGEEIPILQYAFLPVQRVSVSLRNEDGTFIYSCADVLLQSSKVYQVIPLELLSILQEGFLQAAVEDSLDEGGEVACGDLIKICTRLGLLHSGTAVVACQTAMKTYFSVRKECDCSALGVQKHSASASEEVHFPDFLCFQDFMGIIAQLCIQVSSISTGVPNVVGFISAGIASRRRVTLKEESLLVVENRRSVDKSDGESNSSFSSSENDGLDTEVGRDKISQNSEGREKLQTIPYNALIEVPYENALKKKSRSRIECADAAEFLLQNIRISGSQRLKRSKTIRSLPPFPAKVVVPSIVSQYEGNEVEGLAQGIHQVSLEIREEYMLEEIVINLSST